MARRPRREGVSGRRGAGGGRCPEVRAGAGGEHRRKAKKVEKGRGQSTEEKEGMRRREESFTGKKVSREGIKRLR